MHSHSCFLNYLWKTRLFGIASKCHKTAATNTCNTESNLIRCSRLVGEVVPEIPALYWTAWDPTSCSLFEIDVFPLGVISISSSICAIQRVDEKLPDGSRKSLKIRLLSSSPDDGTYNPQRGEIFKEAALPVEISDFCRIRRRERHLKGQFIQKWSFTHFLLPKLSI